MVLPEQVQKDEEMNPLQILAKKNEKVFFVSALKNYNEHIFYKNLNFTQKQSLMKNLQIFQFGSFIKFTDFLCQNLDQNEIRELYKLQEEVGNWLF